MRVDGLEGAFSLELKEECGILVGAEPINSLVWFDLAFKRGFLTAYWTGQLYTLWVNFGVSITLGNEVLGDLLTVMQLFVKSTISPCSF